MKSLPNTQPNARKFPLVDYHYQAPMLNAFEHAMPPDIEIIARHHPRLLRR